MRASMRSQGVSHVSALTLLGVLIVLVAGAVPAGAKPPEELIVFTSDRGGQLDIYTMRPDGSGQVRLTNDKTDDFTPAWSRTARSSPGLERTRVPQVGSG